MCDPILERRKIGLWVGPPYNKSLDFWTSYSIDFLYLTGCTSLFWKSGTQCYRIGPIDSSLSGGVLCDHPCPSGCLLVVSFNTQETVHSFSNILHEVVTQGYKSDVALFLKKIFGVKKWWRPIFYGYFGPWFIIGGPI